MKFFARFSALIMSVIMCLSVFSVSVGAADKKLAAVQLKAYCNLISQPVLEWNSVKGANAYRIYRTDKKNAKPVWLKTVKGNSFTDKSAEEKTTYYYCVKAVNIISENKKIVGKCSNTVKQKALRTILVGDSLMQGVKEYNGLPGGNFVTKIGVGPNSFYNYAYREYLINGKPSKGVDKVISTKANRIFIMLGMNEIDWNSKERTVENYKKVLVKIKNGLPKAQIIVLATSPTGERRVSGVPNLGKVNAYNKAVKKLCKELKLEYYDYTAVFKNDKGYLAQKYNGGDGCHWNKAGVDLFVDQLEIYVKNH